MIHEGKRQFYKSHVKLLSRVLRGGARGIPSHALVCQYCCCLPPGCACLTHRTEVFCLAPPRDGPFLPCGRNPGCPGCQLEGIADIWLRLAKYSRVVSKTVCG